MTRPPLTVAVAQPVCVPRDVAANADAHAAAVLAAGTLVAQAGPEPGAIVSATLTGYAALSIRPAPVRVGADRTDRQEGPP
jgi:hypothetical protein